MKGFENMAYIIAYFVSNILGILFLWAGYKNQKIARLMFFFLFAWAGWMNYTTAQNTPTKYLEYSTFTGKLYTTFIYGWFQYHITAFITVIAGCQVLIALGMLLNGWWVKLACVGTIIFLIGIAPLGVGAAFPFSLTVSLAAYFILRKDSLEYLWKSRRKPSAK